ncbi:uncharacterized protein [Anabrus simplex]|uniref:uncharacterized protein isoform X2 n=1 Tax=Anabrus simplex TaxID=316456 RepID=UPI0034DCC566
MQQYYDAKCNVKGGNGKNPPNLLNYVKCDSTKRVADAIEKILKCEVKDDTSSSSSENDDSGVEDEDSSDPSYEPYKKRNPKRPSSSAPNKRQRFRHGNSNDSSPSTRKGNASDPSEDGNRNVSQLIREFEDLMNDVMGKTADVNVAGTGNVVLCSLEGYEDIPLSSLQGSDSIILEFGTTDSNGTVITTQMESFIPVSNVCAINKDWDKDIREIASMDPLVISERPRKAKKGIKSIQKNKGAKEKPSMNGNVPRKLRQKKNVSFSLKTSTEKLRKSRPKASAQPCKGILKRRVSPTYAEGAVPPRKEILKKRGPRSAEERAASRQRMENPHTLEF